MSCLTGGQITSALALPPPLPGSADPDGDAITIEEVAAFFEEVGITDMDSDVAVYLVSFELGSPSMGRLERKAFVDGWAKAKCVQDCEGFSCAFPYLLILSHLVTFLRFCRVDSIEGMKKEVPKWRKRFVSEPEYFRQVYKYVYDLGRQDGAKVIGASFHFTETI